MVSYARLTEDAKRKLREFLNVERLSAYSLEDKNVLIMYGDELYEYIFLYDITKYKEAIQLIKNILSTEILEKDINKSIQQILLSREPNVIELSENIYAYKE